MERKRDDMATSSCYKYPKRISLVLLVCCVGIFRLFYSIVFISPQYAVPVSKKSGIPQTVSKTYPRTKKPWSKQSSVNCKRIIDGDQTEITRAIAFVNTHPKRPVTPEKYMTLTRSCRKFKKKRSYILTALDEQEENFPIAYCITIYKDVEQFERLLRAIYRPQNHYCIHVDKKSPEVFHRAVHSISDCFENVFVASSLVDVRWGEFTVLQADLICMKDLWKRYKKWKYFINLTGQEFPLRTNNEMVEILKSYNGTADVRTQQLFANSSRKLQQRIQYKYHHSRKTKYKLKPPPYDLTLSKGPTHVVLPRSFVNYIFQSWVAKDFLEWLKNTFISDETYIPTLNNSPQLMIPGQYTGERPSFVRYKNWQYNKKSRAPCYGKVVRGICINGIRDLQTLTRSPKFFVNKFHLDFQHFTLDCLEEWLYNRTRAYYQGDLIFDVTPYAKWVRKRRSRKSRIRSSKTNFKKEMVTT